jgi:hypothetical protein
MEAVGLKLPVGNSCFVLTPSGQRVDAEVVGFSGDRLFLMPSTDIYGLKPGALVIPVDPAVTRVPRLGEDFVPRRRAEDRARQVAVGQALLGRVVDGGGRPLDDRGALPLDRYVPLHSRPVNPLDRMPIRTVLDVGVRSINPEYLNVGRVLKLSWPKTLRRIIIPGSLPYVFTGYRLSLGLAWLVIVASEMLTGAPGVGGFLWQEYNSLVYSHILLSIITIGLIGFGLDRLMGVVERRFKSA